MKNMMQKIYHWYDAKLNKNTPSSAEVAQKFPLMSIIFGPYRVFIDNTRKALVMAAIYAFVISVVFLLLGQNIMCMFDDNPLTSWCNGSLLFYAVSRAIGFLLIALFCMRYYRYSLCNCPFSWRFALLPQKHDIKIIGAFLVLILFNMLSVLSAYLLYIRDANPNWRIELIYFAFVSIGFIIPFMLLRLYSFVAFVLEGKKLPPVSEVWNKTQDNGLRLLFSVALMFTILVFSLNAVMGHFRLVASENTFYISFIAEYIFNLVVLLNVEFFVNYCYLQKEILYGEK